MWQLGGERESLGTTVQASEGLTLFCEAAENRIIREVPGLETLRQGLVHSRTRAQRTEGWRMGVDELPVPCSPAFMPQLIK